MNAFLKILEQLISAVTQESWLKQRYYPFDTRTDHRLEVFDACVFHQDADGALGIAWLKNAHDNELMTFPFRIARYSRDGDLITLPPWSLREATTDALFYSTWKQAVASVGQIGTMRGGALLCRQFEAHSSFNIINLWTDNKNASTRVETQHLCKIFRVLDPAQPHSVEADILEYLNSQNHFLYHPELTTRYDFVAANSELCLPVAIVTRYIQSNAKLWQDLTAKIQHARYPEPMRERSSHATWVSLIETTGRLGRMLAEFHIAMAQCRDNALIHPVSNTGGAREQWSKVVLHKLNERVYLTRKYVAQFQEDENLLAELPEFAHDLFHRVMAAEHLGLLVRIHGHAHLGQVLSADEHLYLVNYETDSLDDEEYRLQKQSCLKDLTATVLSLRYAWLTTERNEDLPVFGDILGADSEFTKHIIKNLKKSSTPVRYTPSLKDLEDALTRSYLQSLSENSANLELLPEKAQDLENLFSLCLLMRVLKETVRDFRNHNPRYKIDLQILAALTNTQKPKGQFGHISHLLNRSTQPAEEFDNYGVDGDFS